METDLAYVSNSGVSEDGGCGILDPGASGCVRGSPVSVNATRSDDSAALINHSTELLFFERSAYRTWVYAFEWRDRGDV